MRSEKYYSILNDPNGIYWPGLQFPSQQFLITLSDGNFLSDLEVKSNTGAVYCVQDRALRDEAGRLWRMANKRLVMI
jgi:hypothetical protein